MGIVRGEHYHVYKFEDSDPEIPYGTYLGTEQGIEFAMVEYEKMKEKHPGTWLAICERDCLEKFLPSRAEGNGEVCETDLAIEDLGELVSEHV